MPESWYLMSQPLFNSGFEGDEFSAFAQGGFEEILDSPLADEIEIYEKTLSATSLFHRTAEKLLSTLFMISIVRSMALVKHLKTI